MLAATADDIVSTLRAIFMAGRTPESVADAIVAAILKPHLEVYVPRSAGTLLAVTRLLPAKVAQAIGKRMGADHVFLDALDRPDRSSYEARATGRSAR